MAIGVLIMGESGTGKSTSMRNFEADEISLVNVAGKPLPFRGKFSRTAITEDAKTIVDLLNQTKSKTIILDDAGYIMGFSEMKKRNEKGFQKFVDIGGDFFDIVDCIRKLPDDVVVYLMMHIETTSDGTVKAKTSGQMLDKKLSSIEGMFSIVMRTEVNEGHYFFRTHNNGADTVKTPMGLFEADLIDNDLKAVDSKIREYYGIN